MSHSKRNTSRAVFTSYERSLLRSTWGSRSTRLSRDSFLPFGSCGLCLLPARNPVACAVNGDLFCRECAVNDLLAQRKEIERLERERERWEREGKEEDERVREIERERERKEFEALSSGAVGVRGAAEKEKRAIFGTQVGWGARKEEDGKGANGQLANGNVEGGKGIKRKAFELDAEQFEKAAKENRDKIRKEMEDEKAAKTSLPSFWVPSLTPSTDTALPKDVKLHPLCPASTPENKHEYSLKNLVTVQFTEEEKGEGQSGSAEPIRICPACKKGLSNSTKAMLAKPCGHVLCKPCTTKFMSPDPHAESQSILCYVCSANLTDNKKDKKKKSEGKKEKSKVKPGLVEIRSDGTGFAGGGENMAKSVGTAFAC